MSGLDMTLDQLISSEKKGKPTAKTGGPRSGLRTGGSKPSGGGRPQGRSSGKSFGRGGSSAQAPARKRPEFVSNLKKNQSDSRRMEIDSRGSRQHKQQQGGSSSRVVTLNPKVAANAAARGGSRTGTVIIHRSPAQQDNRGQQRTGGSGRGGKQAPRLQPRPGFQAGGRRDGPAGSQQLSARQGAGPDGVRYKYTPAVPGRQLKISGIPSTAAKETIFEICMEFGDPTKSWIIYDRSGEHSGAGCVIMQTAEQAKEAVRSLNGKVIRGVTLRAELDSVSQVPHKIVSSGQDARDDDRMML